jgi:hypothetical protein
MISCPVVMSPGSDEILVATDDWRMRVSSLELHDPPN